MQLTVRMLLRVIDIAECVPFKLHPPSMILSLWSQNTIRFAVARRAFACGLCSCRMVTGLLPTRPGLISDSYMRGSGTAVGFLGDSVPVPVDDGGLQLRGVLFRAGKCVTRVYGTWLSGMSWTSLAIVMLSNHSSQCSIVKIMLHRRRQGNNSHTMQVRLSHSRPRRSTLESRSTCGHCEQGQRVGWWQV